MPSHRIEPGADRDEDLIDLAPAAHREPPPMLARGIAADARVSLDCPECGYDLRGLTSSVCPECGTPINDATLHRAREIAAGIRKQPVFKQHGLMWRTINLFAGLGLRRTWTAASAALLLLLSSGLGCGLAWLVGGEAGLQVYLGQLARAVTIGPGAFMLLSIVWLGVDETLGPMLIKLAAAFALTSVAGFLLALFGPLGPLMAMLALVVLVAMLTEMLDLDIADALIAGGLSWLAVQLVGAYFLFA